jgi:hypothetical protein
MSYTPKFILKTCLFVSMAGFVTGYTLFQAQNLIVGPVITLNVPQGNIPSEVTLIKGSAKNISFITFNGRQIYTDKEGQFSEKVLLSQGFNVVKVTGQDRFGRTVDKTLELVLKESQNGYALTINNETPSENNRL